MVTVETISIVFTGLSISLAAFYYISTLRNAQRNQELALRAQEQALETRLAQLSMQIVNQWSQPIMVESRALFTYLELTCFEDYVKLWQDPETTKLIGIWGSYMEGIGVLVREKHLDIRVIAGLMGGIIKTHWEKLSPYVIEMREKTKTPRAWIEWEYLYNELMRYAEKHPERSIQESEMLDPKRAIND